MRAASSECSFVTGELVHHFCVWRAGLRFCERDHTHAHMSGRTLWHARHHHGGLRWATATHMKRRGVPVPPAPCRRRAPHLIGEATGRHGHLTLLCKLRLLP